MSNASLSSNVSRGGGCFCGAVRLVMTGPPEFICICHCRSCRRATGGVMVGWATWRESAVQSVTGTPAELHSSPGVTRRYCAQCGTHLSYAHVRRPGELDITLGSLDDASDLAPTVHIWVSEKLPWVILSDGLPQHERTAPQT